MTEDCQEDIDRMARVLNRAGPTAALAHLLDEAERYVAAEEEEGRTLPHLRRACRIAHAAIKDQKGFQ